ncbi:hypothetical protein ABT297_29095 [Dactylosporangium sp. NPDC000555]|uniref:hypothetical protein n=1 Tax=Dactylosporangium sp. NPDC000555 TaxID=3154260 RepID=UPI00332F4FC9
MLTTPHPTGYADREAAMPALGDPPPAGCAGAYTARRGGPSRLPRSLRETRRELMCRVAADESGTLESMLDAGLDPHCRDGDGRTLPHLLPCPVPDESRLRLRLLAAGLDPRARDRFGRTPARLAELDGAAPELIAALRRGALTAARGGRAARAARAGPARGLRGTAWGRVRRRRRPRGARR